MSFNSDQLDAMLARKRAAVDEARRALDVAMAELRTWQEAIQLLKGEGSRFVTPAIASRNSLRATAIPKSSRRRGPKGAWTAILAALDREFPASGVFGLADVERVAAQVGEALRRPTVRSQMSNYAKSGVVERVEEGRFRLKKAAGTGAPLFKETAPPSSKEGAA